MAEAAHGRVAYHQIITISYYQAILPSQQRTYHVLKAKCVDGGSCSRPCKAWYTLTYWWSPPRWVNIWRYSDYCYHRHHHHHLHHHHHRHHCQHHHHHHHRRLIVIAFITPVWFKVKRCHERKLMKKCEKQIHVKIRLPWKSMWCFWFTQEPVDLGDYDFNSSPNVVRNDKGGQVIGFLSKLWHCPHRCWPRYTTIPHIIVWTLATLYHNITHCPYC